MPRRFPRLARKVGQNGGQARRRVPRLRETLEHRFGKPGRKARHLFLYEIVDDQAQLYGFFYDGMDLPNAWKDRTDP